MSMQALETAGTGMSAERVRMDVIADNLANANSTRREDGEGPYMRKTVTFEPRSEEQPRALGQFEPPSGLKKFRALSSQGQSMNLDPGHGVRAKSIQEAEGEPKRVHQPGHPDANDEGYVEKPNVNPVEEMVDMIGASRSYEANVSTVENSKQMIQQAMSILQ